MTKKKQIKRFAEHNFNVEIEELNKLIPKVLEMVTILDSFDVTSIKELEDQLNKKTGFVKASLSAEALGVEMEWGRLMRLNKELDDALTIQDVDVKNKSLKKEVIDAIRERHTTYYTSFELVERAKMQKVIDLYNDLSLDSKQRLIIDRNYKLQFNPFVRF